MKLQILQENLSKAVGIASRFASSKAQLPVLGNVFLSTKKTRLVIASTNLETSVSISIGAKIEKEGEITVPARVINELVSNLAPGSIELETEKEQLKITSGGFSSNVSSMNAVDFPVVPNLLNKSSSLVLPKREFLDSISDVIFATSTDETRPVLTGVLFLFQKGGLTLVATDGFRLSKKEIKLKGIDKSFKLILPRSAISELLRLPSEDEDVVFDFNEEENQALFGLADLVLGCRILEGDFPDFQKIIPTSFIHRVSLDKEEFFRAIKLASVFARDSGNIVKFTLGKDFLEVSAESPALGSQKTKVDARIENKGSGEVFEITFNCRFLEEFLQVVSSDEVVVEFSSDASPGVFNDQKDENLLHLIMPVRIQT